MIAGPVEKDLRLVFESAKRSRVNDPRTIALELGPVSVPRFRVAAPARIARFLRVGRKRALLVSFDLLARLPAHPSRSPDGSNVDSAISRRKTRSAPRRSA